MKPSIFRCFHIALPGGATGGQGMHVLPVHLREDRLVEGREGEALAGVRLNW
jgi:hypothetical protein